LTARDWRDLSARMSEQKAKPEASFAAAAISGKEADPWRGGIVGWLNFRVQEGWYDFRVATAYLKQVLTHDRTSCVRACQKWP